MVHLRHATSLLPQYTATVGRAKVDRERNNAAATASVKPLGEAAAAIRRGAAAPPGEAARTEAAPTEAAGAEMPLTCTPAAAPQEPESGCLWRTCTACTRCRSASAPRNRN